MGDHWPEPETLPAAPPPVPPPDDRRIGSGMLLALAVLALVGLGFLITWLLTRNSSSPQASTIVITSATISTHSVTTTTQVSTSTTTPTTTAPSPPPPAQPVNATVPDVTQQSEEDGADSLVKAGLLPSIAFVPAKDPLGTIEAQGQSSGSTVAYHSHVQINVSSGPGEKPLESVPNLIGRKLPQAVSMLNAAGLRLIYVRYPITDKSKAGTIVQQTPLAGSRAPHNAQVLVYMAAVE